MKSIQSRIMRSNMAVIIITIFAFEAFLIIFVNSFYINNIKDILLKQAISAGNFYHDYISTQSTDINYQELAISLAQSSNAEVQITDKTGKLLADSLWNYESTKIDTPDIKVALTGQTEVWQGYTGMPPEAVFSLSYPLKTRAGITGAVRYITSLTDVKRVIGNITKILLAAGIAILFVIALIGLFLSRTIVNPVKKLIEQTEEIAAGDYTIRLTKKYDDEIGALSDTMNHMLEEINKNDRLKNEFISSISHELRTPLTAINGWSITLRRPEMEDKESIDHGLDIIEKESSRLSSLLEELLDFSKLSSGKITLHLEPLNINDTVTSIKDQMIPRAQRQNIEILMDLEQGIKNIKADPDRLKQVLINILDNSLKFTEKGGRIYIRTETTDRGIIVQIRDTGIGIDSSVLPVAKKKFCKGNQKGAGSGIGLAICEEIVLLHGGKLNIESELQKGTEVSVFLPFNDAVTNC
ncbi:HAMP domain-containing sensor histidine kinase [Desulfosporosinus sp. OT]|uniref:sensor histidine kinase n=1 Tax=Desulfosporosinus sp. OT TaxID=913865 RepID=UPI00058AF21A|nr:HAMP domain-containing sensor histidine kinase [Desulfosporosinus sp. OT]